MKKIITLLFILLSFSSFAQLINPADTTGTLITAAIRPNSQADNIASAYGNEIRGATHHYQTWAELLAMKSSRLVQYQLATVADSAGKVFQYDGAEWISFFNPNQGYVDLVSDQTINGVKSFDLLNANSISGFNKLESSSSYTAPMLGWANPITLTALSSTSITIAGDVTADFSVGDVIMVTQRTPGNTETIGNITAVAFTTNTRIDIDASIPNWYYGASNFYAYQDRAVVAGMNIALGLESQALGYNSLSLGRKAISTSSISIGDSVVSYADNMGVGVSIGSSIKMQYPAVAIGSNIDVRQGVVIGRNLVGPSSSGIMFGSYLEFAANKGGVLIGDHLNGNSDNILIVGNFSDALGHASNTFGRYLSNPFNQGTVVGQFNEPTPVLSTLIPTGLSSDSPLFIVGGGQDINNRANKMILDYGGNLRIPGNMSLLESGTYMQDGNQVVKISKGTDPVIYTNVYVGKSAGSETTNQTVVGSNSGSNNTGTYQTAMGYLSGGENEGAFQSAFGYEAGYNNTGITQTVLGAYAGMLNTGSNQLALGYQAGQGNTGNNIVAIGYKAGENNILDNQFILKQENINSTALIQGDFLSGNVKIANSLFVEENKPVSTVEYVDSKISEQNINPSVINDSVFIDFSESEVFKETITGVSSVGSAPEAFFIASNLSAIKSRVVSIYLYCDSPVEGLSPLTFPVEWKWKGTKPASMQDLESGILTLQNFGDQQTDIVASYVILN